MKGVMILHNIRSKLFSAFLSFVMVLSLAPAMASRADSKCGDNAYYKVEGSKVTISGTGAMWDYEHPEYGDPEEGAPAPWVAEEADRNAIKTVVIEEGITTVGKNTFACCRNLTSVSLPKSLKKLCDGAFDESEDLKSITLPTGLKSIGFSAFHNSGLESINIPNTVTTISEWAFYDANIKSLYIPKSVTYIGLEAFSWCTDLVSVTGGAGLKTIRAGAFSNCDVLKSFKISSKKLKKIGSSTFYHDRNLKTLYLKKTTKLTKSGVKKSLKGSSIKKIKVKKSMIRKYKKIFKKSNSGRKVKVTK